MRTRRSRVQVVLVGLLAIVTGLGVPAARPAPADAAGLATAASTAAPTAGGGAQAAPAPATWPFDTVQIGFADSPGGAAALRADAPFGLRYQYLAGGVNTGAGWATWNTNGNFVTWYVQESVAHDMVPVFPYYQLLQSSPASGGGEAAKDLNNLKNTTTMASYWADVRLFMQKAEAGASGHPVVLHVEPDLWGYIEQAATGGDAATVPASVASSGFADVAGIANTAAGFAKAFLQLRDLYAPHVLVAYHVSVWGTGIDLHHSQTSDAQTDQLAARAAAFYESLGADFDLAFVDLADRDSGFYEHHVGDDGASWWKPSDFPRYGRFIGGFSAATGEPMVVWQIPMGNTLMRATDDTWGHYADNRPEWFLDDVSDGNLASWRDWGVVALLFGGGAGGTTCACDATHDGVTNPPATGSHTRQSLSADDDGGYLRDRVAAYYRSGGLAITPGTAPPPRPTTYRARLAAKPRPVHRRHDLRITTSVRASRAVKVRVDLGVYGRKGHRFKHRTWTVTLAAGTTRQLKTRWHVGAHRRKARYTIRVDVFETTPASSAPVTRAAMTFRVR